MPAYVIFDALPGGNSEAIKPYRQKAFDTLIPNGRRPIVRTNDIDVRESGRIRGGNLRVFLS